MKIMVLGSGLMGPAAAWNALRDPAVEQVFLCDKDPLALQRAQARLAAITDIGRLSPVAFDLENTALAVQTMAEADVILAALPLAAIPTGLRASALAGKPWVDLMWFPVEQLDELRRMVKDAGILAIFGCGVEPGLTEILARFIAGRLSSVEELHIKCGGIPATPSGPLQYKIVFGGTRLPLHEQDGFAVEEGKLISSPRYGGVERFAVEGVGEVEAWNENFMPWLLDLREFKGLQTGTQKTVRWPGYAHKVTVLKDLGLLSTETVRVGELEVIPKHVVDAVLSPHVTLEDGEPDITIFRIDITGKRKGRSRHYTLEMVDRYDPATGFTSMARTTSFTGMIIARMVARGEIREKGLITPERVITGKLLQRLLKELAANNIRFELRSQRERFLA